MPFYFENNDEEASICLIIKNLTYYHRCKILETLNENKSKMLAQVVHELRTPLNCMISLMELSQQTTNIKKVHELLAPGLASAKILSNMIHDLLDLA